MERRSPNHNQFKRLTIIMKSEGFSHTDDVMLFAHFLKIHSELVYSAKNVSINRLQFEIKTIY